MIRQPIVSVLGHVDHGKTSLLDSIRGSAVAAKEAGGITQAIGASIIPIEVIQKICGDLLKKTKLNLTIPGLLFIDTPGHAAFVNLRKRGGNLADIAIVVIDLNEGLMLQTKESIEILKQYKTPFIIAANKVDLIPEWRNSKKPLIQSLEDQSPKTIVQFETKVYEIVGKLFELGFNADRFDRVSDYTKQIAIIPVSAKTKEGIPELLMVLTGLAQKYLEENLKTNIDGPAKGTVLEIKQQEGLGSVMDVIIYDGTLKVGDQIIVGAIPEPVISKVKALFQPAPLSDMRESKSKFISVKEVSASISVRLVAPGTDTVVGGMPLVSASKDIEGIKEKIAKEVQEVLTETDEAGIVIKADTLGSLEALKFLLKERNIPVRKASVGIITKKDITSAESIYEKNPLQSVILSFNLPQTEESTEKVKIILSDIIYRLIEDYEKWVAGKKKNIELAELESLTSPCKIELLKGYVFRQSNPAVVGVDVSSGTLKNNTPLMKKDGQRITTVKGIQQEQEKVKQLEKNKRGAVSMTDVIVGRQIKEGDILYSAITENEFKKFKEYKEYLTNDQKELLKEIAIIMRAKNPVWGV